MKVNKLRVRAFRNISDTTLDVTGAKFIVVRGENRNGKTSIAEALSLALTPTTWGLSAKGDGYVRKIKRGEAKSILELDLQGANRLIRRTVTLNTNSSGRTQSSDDPNDPSWNSIKFDRLLDDKKAALGIAVNTRSFMSMVYSGDEKAQKNLLAQLVLPAHYEFPKDTIADVESLLGTGTIGFDGEPFMVIEQAYTKLFKDRQEVNRKIKEFVLPAILPLPNGVNSESLKAQLSTLKEARQNLVAGRQEDAKKASEVERQLERYKARIETMEAALKANKESLRLAQEAILPNLRSVEEIASRKDERKRLLAEQQRLQQEQDSVKQEQGKINKISSLGAQCPTCDQEIEESKLVELAKGLIDRRNRITEEHVQVTQALAALGDVEGSIVKLERHKKAFEETAELVRIIEESTKALNNAKDESEKDMTSLFDFSTFDKAIAEADRNIEAVLQRIHPVIAAEERAQEIATKKEQLTRLEAKASKLDSLVKFFDKDGIKAKLIADYIGGFEQKCNEVLKVWDYSCSLSIEPFRFEVTDYRNVSTPLIELSGAEELMFYAAFQCAVSRTAGIGFVVIDRVDTLLPNLRPKLYQKLYEMVKDNVLDQIILLVADTSEQVPKLPDSSFFIMEDGNLRRLYAT